MNEFHVVFGNFNDLVLAFWGGVNIEVASDVTYRTKATRALVFNIYEDSNVIRPVSFAAKKDILTTAFN